MLSKKKGIIVLSLMLLVAVMAGCSGDSVSTQGDADYKVPVQVIAGISSAEYDVEFEATGGTDYYWEVEGGDINGRFVDPTLRKPQFIATNKALQDGEVRIRVTIDDEVKPYQPVEILNNDTSITEYAKGAFHAILDTDDMGRKGYIAAGTIGTLGVNNRPYMVKANNQGLVVDQKEFNRGGRFYDVQDVVRKGLGDFYYLVGYEKINDEYHQAFALKLNNNMEIEKEYEYGGVDGNVFLRSGIVSKRFFSNDHLIAVGNYQLDNGNYAPYIIDIDEETGDKEEHILIKDKYRDSTYNYEFSNVYYDLESIVATSDGYLAVGLTNEDNIGVHHQDTTGILVKLNSDFGVEKIIDFSERLFKIKKGNDNKFVIVGDKGYIAEIDSNGNIYSNNLGENLVFRDVVVDVDGTDYVVVGEEAGQGVVVKIASGSSDYKYKQNYGKYLYGVAQATDNDYLLAGHSADENSYVVKVDSNLEVVKRVKE